ncbi:hypothetical protein L8P35_10680 [Enterobacter cloacae]|uniref:tail fiber/spike domain-containing protein n=1 Tax=Enterobacter cloacae TaxID=550 RepID=UPI002006C55D|nr:hypothetical protein [Enterobacter cloacae]MCK7317167.1 hypothetical protein [Enterobacter cloacae]
MATQPTNLPVPSESPRDLKFNAGKIDEFVTSLVNTYVDRFGNEHYTIEGLRWLAQQAIAQFGYITLDSFEDGNTLTLPNQVLHLEATGEYYRWDGALPKVVPDNSTPETTGGIGPGAWLSVGDATLRGEVFALNGGVTRGFQTVADMKSFGGISPGHTYSTAGYYSAGDGGGALYIAATSGSTPDGYGDHVASNGVFLRLISQPTDLNHGVIINATYDPTTAWNNRNAIQTMLRNERWSNFELKAQGVLYHLGSTHVGRDNISVHIKKGCRIIGRFNDPSIPDSLKSQSGGMLGFAKFFDPDNGDFIPWRDGDTRVNARIYNVHIILDGEVSTEYNAIHSSKYNNNCIAFLKASNCSVTGSGGVAGSDHRGINFDGIDTNAPNGSDNRGGSVNCRIDVGYSANVVDNHLMIFGDNTSVSTHTIKVGFLGPMLSGGYNSPIGVRVTNANVFNIKIGSFSGDNVVKPPLVASYGVTQVNVKAGYVNGASKILYQNETLYSDVEVSQIYNTPIGIERAGTATGKMRSASFHDVKYTDNNFSYPYYSNNNVDGFFRLKINDNFFGNASSSFAYYGNRVPAGMPTKMDIRDNISPSSMTVVEFNQLPQSQSANLITVGATSAVINYKTPDWNYSKMTVIAQASGVYGACEIDIRTRIVTSQNVAYSAGAITVNTALSGNNITITLSAGAALAIVTMHN